MNHNYTKPNTSNKPSASKQSLFNYFRKVTKDNDKQPSPSTPKPTANASTFIDLTDDDDLVMLDDKPKAATITLGRSNTSIKKQQNNNVGYDKQGFVSSGMLKSISTTPSSTVNTDYKGKPKFSSLSAHNDPLLSTSSTSSSTSMNRVTPMKRTAPISRASGLSLTQHNTQSQTSWSVGAWKATATNNATPFKSEYNSQKRPRYTTDHMDYSNRRRELPTSFDQLRSKHLSNGKDNMRMAHLATSNYSHSSTTSFSSNQTHSSTRSSSTPSSPRSTTPSLNVSNQSAPTLSPEQQRVYNIVVNDRQSVFFTGSAGTGKSVLLRAIIEKLKSIYGAGVAVTASTGIAACNISGCTLHSFSGIGLGKDNADILAEKVMANKKKRDNWINTRVLIIDEISMVDGQLFDKIEYVARAVRQNSAPFGGLQVVITGDFFQLPPVSGKGAPASKFAFEAQTWNSVVKRTIMLKQVFRQKDETFVKILNEMRVGKLSTEALTTFRSLARLPESHSKLKPTELYPLRDSVNSANRTRLESLPGEPVIFRSRDYGRVNADHFMAPDALHLKINAQVMLLKNMDATLVNGSMGIVKGFAGQGAYADPKKVRRYLLPNKYQGPQEEEPDVDSMCRRNLPIIEFMNGRTIVVDNETWSIEMPNGEIVASRTQLPLMLAWAMSIHKSQGQTLDSVRVDLGKAFEKGQAYVALSRATSLESLQIVNFNPSVVMCHPKVTEFYKRIEAMS